MRKAQQEFINIAAHELRTPIQPIIGLSEVLRPKLGRTVTAGEYLGCDNQKRKKTAETVPSYIRYYTN